MKVLITGATGYIGSQLAKRLHSKGHEISLIVRPNSDLTVLDTILPSARLHYYDGSYQSLYTSLAESKPDIVFHIASLFLAQHKPEDVARLVDSNLNFPTQLLEAMSQLGIKQFINTGTSWQHYQNEGYNPVNLYAASKQAFEAMLAYYVEVQEFKSITLKLFDTYGPGDSRPKLFSLLRKTACNGEILRMSPGEQLIDLVYIDDVLDAYELALARLPRVEKSECYAISKSERLSLRDLVKVYADTIERDIHVEWGGLPYRAREVMTPWANYHCLPNWQANTSLQNGIINMENDPSINGLLCPSRHTHA